MAVSERDAPFSEPYAKAGNPSGFRSKGNTALAVKRALAHLKFLEWEPDTWDEHWNQKLSDAAAAWKRKRGLIHSSSNDGSWGARSHETMRGTWFMKGDSQMPAFDGESQRLLRVEYGENTPAPDDPVPNLGPVWQGGVSVLEHELTHATSGIPLYPAFDDAFVEGRTIVAPEALEVVAPETSSNPGEAFYARGDSGLEWWFGHLASSPAIGARYAKGKRVGEVGPNSIGGGPHVHVGVNVESLWGLGAELTHHTDYTYGAPTIGDQLGAGRPL